MKIPNTIKFQAVEDARPEPGWNCPDEAKVGKSVLCSGSGFNPDPK